jgi:hypothetical protein
MGSPTKVATAGLQGWRGKVADAVAQPVARRTPLDPDQVRALVGATFFVLSVVYVVTTLRDAAREARRG